MSNVVPLLHTIITSGSSGPKLNNLPGPSTSFQHEAPSFYIQGWLTMGKLCLADAKLAKNYIPLFVQVDPVALMFMLCLIDYYILSHLSIYILLQNTCVGA